MPALPPGLLAAAAEDEPAGPRRRVLELADALAGAAYWYARILDARDPYQALTGLRSAIGQFTEQLLEAAQANHDGALAAHAPRPAAHLDAAPAHLDTPEAHLDGPPVSDRRFELAEPAGGTTRVVPGPAGGTTGTGTAPGPGPAPTPESVTERFENRPVTEAELEEAQRILTSPQLLARVSLQLRSDTALVTPARAATVPQTDTRPAPAAPAALPPAAPPNPFKRGIGDCDILLALPQLGPGWQLAGWRTNALAQFVLHNGEIVGWVEIGIDAVPRWAAITDGHLLTDTDTWEPLFHASPERAARTVRQDHLARRPGR
ncbi:hypothetical protein [Kitasatospora herbaricolor]|uniref:hypothetical protein n=1 Tax=Kitasatospora herbaricolor TaxID=68217 RepID=UPI0036DE7446